MFAISPARNSFEIVPLRDRQFDSAPPLRISSPVAISSQDSAMLNQEENQLLTAVGPGTPAGQLLRRYWHPIAPAVELTDLKPKKRVRVLGEDLLLYRDRKGGYGLVGEHCSHRGASLYYGFVEEDGIRCPYHGWRSEE